METRLLAPSEENIAYAAALLRQGQVVGMPTETVYGLAASAYDPAAVEKIFTAKGRPRDNPLIVHVASAGMLLQTAASVPATARRLAERFWPGPLTMIFEKQPEIPPEVTAGLSTVAVRFPSHPVAAALIRRAGVPLAAPSANLSGRPSPTSAAHVYGDLQGKIPAVLDGGDCGVGLESTVLLPKEGDRVILLRPGGVTVEMLRAAGVQVEVGHGVLHEMQEGEKALSPGLLHRHYSPKTRVIILEGDFASFREYVSGQAAGRSAGAMVFDGEEQHLSLPCVTFGGERDLNAQARLLFQALRKVDALGVEVVYARMPCQEGIGLATYNRLLRAAGFEVISL